MPVPPPTELSRDDQLPEDLRDDPHGDRELATSQSQGHERRHEPEDRGDQDGDRHREVAIDAGVGQVDGGVGADPDERLLADRHQTAVAGQGVPHRRHQDQDPEAGQLLGDVGVEGRRHEEEADDDEADDARSG